MKGRWERIVYDLADYPAFRCSRCGFKALDNHYNFCPDCGADMREEKELLKKCPFCGAAPEIYYNDDEVRCLRTYVVGCKLCKAKIEQTRSRLIYHGQCKKDIIEAWNRRTHE